MQSFLLVALGGALGACARYGVSVLIGAHAFPWATLAINVAGGMAMGVLVGLVNDSGHAARLLLGVGVLGGFTTFSAFSLETVRLAESGQTTAAFGYVLASVILSISACWLGLAIARSAS
ncbi:MAG: fluoride efflux transporter CrcB [Caulobacterales bacterium]